jgi:hypothetical protein
MRRLPSQAQLPVPAANITLRPAELAYLWRNGDITHTMLVLVVDLVQRLVKSRGDLSEDSIALQPYERAIAGSVKDFVTNWAHHKVGDVVPIRELQNPMAWLVRLRAIKVFFGETLRNFVADFIKDPLHIRRYFSLTGIMRFTLQLCTTGARQSIEDSMQRLLQERGWLVSSARRHKYALLMLLVIPLILAAAVALRYAFAPQASWLTLTAAMIMGFINAVAVRAVLFLPSLIPSYDEFKQIASELPRGGVRISFIKSVLRFSGLLIVWLTIITALILMLFEFGIDTLLMHLQPAEALALLMGSTLLNLPCVQAWLDYHSLMTRDHASGVAQHLVEQVRQSATATSPLTELKTMLTDPAYDPQFSEQLAIYGVETLWLLG